MAPISSDLSAITNSLVLPSQMIALKHYDESNYPGTANTIHYAQAELTQSAGILLRLPQEVIAQAIVLLQRFTVMNASTDASEISAKVRWSTAQGGSSLLISLTFN